MCRIVVFIYLLLTIDHPDFFITYKLYEVRLGNAFDMVKIRQVRPVFEKKKTKIPNFLTILLAILDQLHLSL